MLYPEQIIEEVRLRNDIVEVVSGYLKLERKGRSYWGYAPFTARNSVIQRRAQQAVFYCFGCNRAAVSFSL